MTAKKNPDIAFMLSVTADYVFLAGNIVLNLIRYRPQKDFRVIIYYESMTPQEQKIFEDCGVCDLLEYSPPERFKEKVIALNPKFQDKQYEKHFSFLKFAKFEIFKHLDDYEKVAWLDADIAVQDDITSIKNYDVPFAITVDDLWTVQNNFLQPIDGYDMSVQGVCSAVFLISRKLKDYKKMRQWCYDMQLKCTGVLKNIDQGVFNLLLQEFDIKWTALDFKVWQCIPERAESNTAKIVHFGRGGTYKIWNNAEMTSCFPEWWRTHLQWVKLGGKDFKRPDNFSDTSAYSKMLQITAQIRALKKQTDSKCAANKKNSYKIYLFNLPLLYRKVRNGKIKYYLLGFFPIWKTKLK